MPSLRLCRMIDAGRPVGRQRTSQHGAASLIVVMVLFFVISMVAAYTNRNLIFEQKTSANQYRSTRALEAAEAGLEWALTLLNTGRLTASCLPSTNPADTDFRQRYLTIDAANGNITTKLKSSGGALSPSCVYDGSNWVCDCPADADPSLTAPSSSGIFPAFRVQLRAIAGQPGVVRIDVNGCTTLDEGCLKFPGDPQPGEGRASVHAVAALRGSVFSPPTAALTSRVTINSTASLGLFNTLTTGVGVTAHAGGAITLPGARLTGPAGTPGAATLVDGDAQLAALSDERLFHNLFGTARNTYRDQPGAIVVNCSGGCIASTVRSKIALNPGRVLWLDGDVDFDSPGDVGSASQPVMIVVTGNASFSSPVTVYGLVYSQATSASSPGTWTASGSGSIVGAAVSEGSFSGTATTNIVFDADILMRLRTINGSFVRVPGSWKDFET